MAPSRSRSPLFSDLRAAHQHAGEPVSDQHVTIEPPSSSGARALNIRIELPSDHSVSALAIKFATYSPPRVVTNVTVQGERQLR